jgi:hypothetical protein
MSTDQPDFGTRIIEPVYFRYPTGWMSWQAILGDLARGEADARLRIEATPTTSATAWTVEVEWGANLERVTDSVSLAGALLALWDTVIDRHALYAGDQSKRGPGVYEPDEVLDIETLAAIQRLLGVARAAFGTDWAVMMTYHPVAQADQRIHARLMANNGAVAVSSAGATLIDGARGLMRAAAPHFPKPPKAQKA